MIDPVGYQHKDRRLELLQGRPWRAADEKVVVDSIVWTFEQFTLHVERRLLTAGGAPVRLGGRALDILIALLECAGRFVTREELTHRIWGERVVSEINLRVQMAALRRALGDDGGENPQFIFNVPNRGYCFVAAASRSSEPRELPIRPHQAVSVAGVPRLTALIGRGAAIAELLRMFRTSRALTIVGPGGVGKSAVAAEIADAHHSHVVFRVDLGGIADAHVATHRIATVLGCANGRSHGPEGIVRAVQDRHMILFLDGCEGVVDQAALLAEAILARAPGVRLLATSREPLRIPGEQVHRLAPLQVPGRDAVAASQSARSSASFQLLTQCAHAASGNFESSPDDIRVMMEICRRLDGIPLAIELAAHGIEHLGLAGVLAQLNEGFDVLTDERRVDAPHQQSLRASFDWSFANLSRAEQRVLCRLSAFAGQFSLVHGVRLAAHDADDADIRELVGQLATKSLVCVETSAEGFRYRLLGSTRECARLHLDKHPDQASTRRKHAELTAELLEAADADHASQMPQDWLRRHASSLDDARLAFDWLSTQPDEDALQMRLLTASVRPWYQLSAVAEFGDRADAVMGRLSRPADDPRLIRITFALGRARLHQFGQGVESLAAFGQAHELARQGASHQDRLVSLWGLWLDHCLAGRYADAATLAQDYEGLTASSDGRPTIAADRMLLASLLNAGRFPEARVRGERALAGIFLMPFTSAGARPHLEEEAIARIYLARVLWIQGLPDNALTTARAAVGTARLSMHAIAICFCLHGLCVVALWSGRVDEARRSALEMAELSAAHRLGLWGAWARSHLSACAFVDGELMQPDWREPPCGVSQLEIMATISTNLLEPELVSRTEAGLAPWCEAEVLRARGCHALKLETIQGRQQALALFERARSLAKDQGALAWELRAATSIAEVWHQQDETAKAMDLLARTLDRFTGESETPDLCKAGDLLARLRLQ